MANSNLKLLLVSFSTDREIDGDTRRVKFKAKSVVNLTDAEIELLTALEKSSGKAHFRDPITEGGKAVESQPEIVELPDFEGQDVAFDAKTIAQLKAYLDFHGVTYADGDKKPELLDAATKHAAGGAGENQNDDDKDGGL